MARGNKRTRGTTGISKLLMSLGISAVAALALTVVVVHASQRLLATDPGPRGGPAGAGNVLAGLTGPEGTAWSAMEGQFSQAISVSGNPACNSGGTCFGTLGLGPRFSSNTCSSCHAQPTMGGSSPTQNPLFSVYQLAGAQNMMPSFETQTGPVLVARFPYQLSNLSLVDGYVHPLFTITGRNDAGSCSLAQPNFNQASSSNDLVFRQPLPLYGDGYIEIVQDTDILNNLNSNLGLKQSLGIGGVAQITDDGSISRMGWKAQWRAILPAVGAEENIEMGVTNEMFPTETDQSSVACLLNAIPEDASNYPYWNTSNTPWNFVGDAERDATFIRFLAQPTPAPQNPSDKNGLVQFNTVGCNLCHNVSFTTPAGSVPQMGHVTINLYSDLLVHHMGPCLADNVVQGSAQGDMFRTPPLWNAGQRLWFLHDARTSDIVAAVEDHFCNANSQYPASEANAVINAFNALSSGNQQDLINFLRSL